MLKLKHLFENYELAKQALTHWRHDEEHLDELLGRYRISANAIYPFLREGELCFLRLAPTDEKLENNLRGELEFIGYLRGRGYPALEPIAADDGRALLRLDTGWGEYFATAFKSVAGVSIDDTDCADGIMLRYGQALGRLHTLSADFDPEVRKWSHTDALDWTAATLEEYDAPSRAFEELDRVRVALSAIPATYESYGLVHYDFEPDNVFYDAAGDSCAVIDFDDGMYHWFALDVEQALDSLGDELEGERLERAREQFMRGYALEHLWTPEMEASRAVMRRFVELFGYARLLRSTAEDIPDPPDWLISLRQKLDGMMRKKEAGFSRHDEKQ